jgi:hypothetical protein
MYSFIQRSSSLQWFNIRDISLLPLSEQPAPPGPSSTSGPKSQCSSTPLGSSPTHSHTPSAISPGVSGNRDSRVREFNTQSRTPNSDMRHLSSTRSGGPTQLRHLLRSCDRGSRDRDFTGHKFLALQNPEPRFSDATCQHPMVRPNALTPVSHSAIGKSRFGNSRLLMHKVTDLAKPRIPTPQDPAPRVPLSDQRLRSIREIAGRDFKEY